MIGWIRKLFAKRETTPKGTPSEKDEIFDAILRVSSRINRAERLKEFGEREGINVGAPGSDAYIAIQNEKHDELMKRYRELLDEEAE